MRDETLVEPLAAPEIFVDGFTDHQVHNGVMTCAGYRIQPGLKGGEPLKVVVVRLVWPVGSTDAAINEARDAQSATQFIMGGPRIERH
jgi:hypothetical protein